MGLGFRGLGIGLRARVRGGGLDLGDDVLAYISPTSRLHLAYISAWISAMMFSHSRTPCK